MNEADEPGSTPGSRLMPKSKRVVRHLVAGEGDVEVAGAHHAQLAGAELLGEGRTVLGLCARRHVARLDLSRANSSTCLTPSPTSGSSPHLPASMVAPDAHISGPTVKMLQPAQLPAR